MTSHVPHRILAVGHGVRPTGYSRVLRALLAGLHQRGHEVHHAAVNWPGPPPHRPWTTHSNPLAGDPYGLRGLPSLLDAVRPDTIIILHDLWVAAQHAAQVRAHRPRSTILVHCPVDGPVSRPELISGLSAADVLIACTRFGSDQLRGIAGSSGPAPPVLPHGLDHGAFRPLDRARHRARRLLFPGQPGMDDAFIVLNANRHNIRKRLDITLEGFRQFAEGKPPNVKLYLHAGLDPRTLPDPGPYLALRKAGRLLHTDRDGAEFPHLPDHRLNLIYNACQVGLNTATAEGFGLVPFEHAATGAAQVMPGHPTCAELWAGSATLLPVGPPTTYPGDCVEHRAVAPSAVAEALERLYADPGLLAERSLAALRNATRREYRWATVLRGWHDLMGGRGRTRRRR